MAPNPRVLNAFNAMKALGISEDVVKPVLKQLLRVFEKNWEPIEEENYRALADAVFEYQEANAATHKRKPNDSNEEEEETQLNDEPERLLKRTRRAPAGQGTPTKSNKDIIASGSALRITVSETGGTPENYCSQHPDKGVTSLPAATSPGNRPHSVRAARISGRQSSSFTLLAEREKNIASHPVIESGAQMYANAMKAIQSQANPNSSTHRKEKGKVVDCEALPKNSIPTSERSSQVLCLKEPKIEPGITPNPSTDMSKALALIQPKKEPFVECATNFPQSDVPSPGTNSDTRPDIDSSNDDCSVRNDGGLRITSSPCLNGGSDDPGFPTNSDRSTVSLDLESTSSPLGEVRLSLRCALPCQSDFRMPSVGAVLKLAEEKCVKTYNVKTSFSVKQVIRDVCDSFLELGSKPNESRAPDHIHNRSCTKDLSNDTCDPVKSKFVPCQSDETVNFKVVVPEICRTPPYMGAVNGHEHPAVDISVNLYEETGEGVDLNSHDNESEHNMAMVVADGFMSIYLADLSDGEERVDISLVNQIDNVCLPFFKYMPQSVVFENASLDISLARIGVEDCCKACIGDCLTSKTPCACATKSGGSFAYTPDGLLTEEFLEECERVYRSKLEFCSGNYTLIRSGSDDLPLPCDGHVARKFIKECWRKCGCNRMCGNRLIQRGITCSLQVFMTPDGKGWGLRALEDLPNGAFVCEYTGEILTLKELHNRYTHSVNSTAYPVILDASWGSEKTRKDETTLCLDGTNYGNIARFINHRCSDSNLLDIPVEVESPDHLYYHVALFTRRKVNALEELTWDYGIDFKKDCNPVKAFECLCGSKYCRDIKMNKWLPHGSARNSGSYTDNRLLTFPQEDVTQLGYTCD